MENRISYASFSSGEYTIGDDSEDWKSGPMTAIGVLKWGITLNIHF